MLLRYLRNHKVFTLICFFVFAVCMESPAALQPEEEATIALFEKTSPSVVFIKNASFQWDWFSTNVYEIPQGAGSGFVWDDRGHIVTNFHVIYQADKIDVILDDKKSYPAKVVGIAPSQDLAVLKIDVAKDKLFPIVKGDSSDLKVGQKILSIGNPFGLDYSLTTGVVSALGRSIKSLTGRKIYDVIQTDAAINPGNSGGPLLNSSGEMIGVTTAIYSPSGAYAGVGFATPVNTVKRIVPQLIKYGKIKRAGLGVTLVPENIRLRLGIKGAMLLEVQRNSAAHKAGLQSTRRNYYGDIIFGDIILSVDDKPVEKNEDLIDYIDRNKKEGEPVNIKFLRGQKQYGTTVVLQEI